MLRVLNVPFSYLMHPSFINTIKLAGLFIDIY
jgi:hypothetical protein